MRKIRVGIIGTGNIGSDLGERLLAEPDFDVVAMIGRNPASKGLQRFKGRVPVLVDSGIKSILPYIEGIDGFFDATSAQSAVENWAFAKDNKKWLIDLTPSKLGTSFVPAISGKISKISISPEFSHNYSMVTCGGQASAPIIFAMSQHISNVESIEISSSIAAKSAGLATRNNIDQYIETTENLINQIEKKASVKSILVINPANPSVPMRTTVVVKGSRGRITKMTEAVREMASLIRLSNPGYELIGDIIQIEKGLFSATVRVTGSGHYLPPFAGNLDIINSAAVQTARMHAIAHTEKF